MDFNENYYYNVVTMYNYNPLDFSPMNFEFHGISRDVMRLKWLCHSGINALNGHNNFSVTTGIGLSGTPHMGTFSQILRAIFLQKNGINVQMVLGDLDSYNARNKSIEYVNDLSRKYNDFAEALGFDSSKGILRNQIDYPEINQFAYLLSKYVTDQDFLKTEEDLSELYIKNKVYDGITFPVKQAILLMIADFLYLGENSKHKNVVVMLGLEEHKYVLLAKMLAQRLGTGIEIYSMYSRIIRGLNGYPKMSKSIKGSAITMDMTASEITRLIVGEADDYDTPENSVVFQMMSSVSDYSAEEVKGIYQACQKKNHEWRMYKQDYAERLVVICDKWKKPY